MVMTIRLVLILWIIPCTVMAQLPEFQQVTRLPAAINTAGEEGMPLLSPDGQLLFTRALYAGNVGGRFSGVDTWSSAYQSGTWKHASNELPGGKNDRGHNAVVGISKDAKQVYFLSAKPGKHVDAIYVTSRVDNRWSQPEAIFLPGIENREFFGVHVSADAQVILLSMNAPDSRGEEDIYFCTRGPGGEWSAPRSLGPTINTAGFEISPFLSPDNRRLYFSSNGHGGEGDADIFYSDRLYDSWETWSAPVNLGKSVNSAKFDAYFSTYGDSVAYFASNRDGRYSDIYEVRIVPSRSVLAPGQRYLSDAEWRHELAGAVSSEVAFAAGRTTLTPAQQELLFYIADRLQLQRSISFHLIVLEEEDEMNSEKRLRVVQQHLSMAGIDAGRIITKQIAEPKKAAGGRIMIRLVE